MEETTTNDRKPTSDERLPGQGNSGDGLTRRLGSETNARGKKETERMKNNTTGEEPRVREGSQGNSKGQKSI